MSTQLTHYSIFWQDHAFAGIGVGTAAVLCLNLLDPNIAGNASSWGLYFL
jgi:hypothetical protein